MAEFKTLLTTLGAAKFADAIALGGLVNLSEMAIGDGNGNPTTPTPSQTALVREVYRAELNSLTIDPDNANYIIAELVVPVDEGGYTVRECGLYSDDGTLIAVANFPATYKPALDEGVTRDLTIRMVIEVTNAETVNLITDTNVALATQQYVLNITLNRLVPLGGTTNQVLTKNSATDGDYSWKDPQAALATRLYFYGQL